MPRDRYDDEDDRPRRRRREDDEDEDRPRRRRRDEDEEDEDDRPRRSRRRREDEDDRPVATQGNGMAVAALVLGLLSICLGPITGVIGGILGLIGMSKSAGKGMAVIGMVLSGLFSCLWIGVGVWGFFESQKMNKENTNFKVLGLATHNHSDANGTLPRPFHEEPGAFNRGPVGDLSDRLSWRVTILPYTEHDNLYRQFKRNEPWNSPTNQPLSNTPIKYYSDADTPNDPATRLRCFYDNGAVFDTRIPVTLNAITDGTTNTILYVEGGDKVTWSRFQEYKFEPMGTLPQLGKPNSSTFMVVMCDGSIRKIRKTTSEHLLKAAITRAGGEVSFLD